MYSHGLTRYEILDNFVADCGNHEMFRRYLRNHIFNGLDFLSTSQSWRQQIRRCVFSKIGADRMTVG